MASLLPDAEIQIVTNIFEMLVMAKRYLWKHLSLTTSDRARCEQTKSVQSYLAPGRAPQFHTKCFCVYHSLYWVSGIRLFLEFFNVCIQSGKQIRSFVVGDRCVVFFSPLWLYFPVGGQKGRCLTHQFTHQDLCTHVSGGASVRISIPRCGGHRCGCDGEIEMWFLIFYSWLEYQPHVFQCTGCWQTWLCSWFMRT